MKIWRDNNAEKRRDYRIFYNKTWPEKVNEKNAKRRAARLNAVPKWLTEEDNNKIKEFYKQSTRLTEETGIKHHVDHIIPLQGENVSGLHHPDNIQVIAAEENMRKSNSYES